MQAFVMECYWPERIEQAARGTLDRVLHVGGGAGRALPRLHPPALLRDGPVLFSAPTEDMVRRIGRLAELPFDRIVESVLVGFSQQPKEPARAAYNSDPRGLERGLRGAP